MDYVLITKDQSEALAHRSHLYTKREWRNGRWYYWYPGEKRSRSGMTSYSSIGRASEDLRPAKFKRTYDKNGNVLTERIVSRKKQTTGDTFKNWTNILKAEQDFHNAKNAGKMLNETDQQHKERINATGRNYAAAMQEHSRTMNSEKEKKNKKFRNRAKKWLNTKVFTTKTTMKDLKTGKTIKSWETPGWKKK